MTNKKSKKYACLPNPNPSSNPEPDIDDGVNTSIINDNKEVVEVIVEEDFPFDKIWEMYDKKVGNEVALRETWKAFVCVNRGETIKQKSMSHVDSCTKASSCVSRSLTRRNGKSILWPMGIP